MYLHRAFCLKRCEEREFVCSSGNRKYERAWWPGVVEWTVYFQCILWRGEFIPVEIVFG